MNKNIKKITTTGHTLITWVQDIGLLIIAIATVIAIGVEVKVMKFGGGCLRNPESFKTVASIVKNEKTKPVVLVASAIYGVTDKLEESERKAEPKTPHFCRLNQDELYVKKRAIKDKKEIIDKPK